MNRLGAALAAFGRGETDVEFLAADFELRQSSSIVDTAGTFRGRDAIGASLRELRESFDELSFEADKVIEAPCGEVVVLVHARGRGRGSGVDIDNHIAWVWTFRGQQAVRLVVYEDQAEALEAVGCRRNCASRRA